MANALDYNAFEIRQLLHSQPYVGTVQGTLIGVIKSITTLNLANEDAVRTVWWPFIKKCFKDLCMYGFCAYYKKTKDGIVTPVYVPVQKCTINYSPIDGINVSPKNADQSVVPQRTKIFILEEPDMEAMHLNSSICRLLHHYKRLSELSTSYIEEEKRIAKPVNFLEETSTNRKDGVYQAVTAANPEWDHGVPGLHLSAKEASDGHANVAEYISNLQDALVDKINRGSEDQEQAVDSLGIRRQEKRKRVQEVQIPLPPGKRIVQHLPSNRCDILRFEDHFFSLVPWAFGLPPVFIEARGGSVSLNTEVIGSVVNGALNNHIENINLLLQEVSENLFGTMSDLVNQSMIVELTVKESGLEFKEK